MKKTYNSEKGFTLIEAMIGMLVFSIGLLGIMSMQVVAIKGNTFGNTNTRASSLCVEMIERMINNAASINAYDVLDTRTEGGPASGVALNDYVDWTQRISDELGDDAFGTVNVQRNSIGGTAVPGANTVAVRVGWGENGEHEIRLQTVVSYP